MGFLSWIFGKASKCPQCGARVKAEYNFCPECKAPAVGAWLLCGKCSATIKAEMKFCPFCREAQDPARVVRETAAIVWKRAVDEFAVRYELEPEFVAKYAKAAGATLPKDRAGVIVEFGTKALLMLDGRLSQILDPGRYVEFTGLGKDLNVKGLDLTTLRNRATVVLISSGDQRTEYELTNLITRDNLKASARVICAMRLKDPAAFFENVMKGGEKISGTELNHLLLPDMTNAMKEAVRGLTSEEIVTPDIQRKQQIEVSIVNHLNKTLGRLGLDFVQFQVVQFEQAEMAEVVKERGEREIAQKRLTILDLLQKQENQQKIQTAQNWADLQKTLLDVDRGKVISREEFDELRRAWDEGRGDREMARKQFQEKVKILYEVELKRTKMLEEGKLTLEQIRMNTLQLKEHLERERLKVDRAKIEADAERERLKLQREKAQLGIDIAKQNVELEGKRAEIERAKIDSLKGMSADQVKYYLAGQSPELVRALVAEAEAKARVEGNRDMKAIYENILSVVKDVSTAAATGKIATAKDAAEFVKIGAIAGQSRDRVCTKCGHRVEANYVACPNCGADLPR